MDWVKIMRRKREIDNMKHLVTEYEVEMILRAVGNLLAKHSMIEKDLLAKKGARKSKEKKYKLVKRSSKYSKSKNGD